METKARHVGLQGSARHGAGAPVFETGTDRIDRVAVDGIGIDAAGAMALGGLACQHCGARRLELWAPVVQDTDTAHLAPARSDGSTRFSAVTHLCGRELWWDVGLSAAAVGLIAQARDVTHMLATIDGYPVAREFCN